LHKGGTKVAKSYYKSTKRQKELERKRKKEEKRQAKLAKKDSPSDADEKESQGEEALQ
jgi:hypothetical protein